ncbi:helix-turn-helix domain-containing protein [Alteribacillus sp. YIM 98480]|nr:helix-turn-helix domain-containing protein [Alteribacillus sp. YIM 98480]
MEVVEACKDRFTTIDICRFFEISSSTYYRWRAGANQEMPELHQLI